MPGPFAAFTITRNEALFLPLWCQYYSTVFGEENCYIIDNDTTDGSVETVKQRFPSINVEQQHREAEHDTRWLLEVVQRKQRQLLASHKVVVFAETDEFLLAKPGGKYKDLHDVCEQLLVDPHRNWIQAQGWQCMQAPDEPAITVVRGEPALKDRATVQQHEQYCKTLVSKVPLSWVGGFHWRDIGNGRGDKNPSSIDSDLALLHLWTLDAEAFMERRRNRMQKWGQLEKWPDMWTMFKDQENSCRLHASMPTPEEWRELLVW
jgi:hypothetical protein